MRKIIVVFPFLLLSLFSCREEIILDLRYNDQSLVIEGVVTDTGSFQQVKVSRTIDFYDTALVPSPVTDALVILSDSQGQVDTLEFDVETGAFVTNNFTAKTGLEYVLDVYDNEMHYRGSDVMAASVLEDSAYAAYLPFRPLRPEGFYPIYTGIWAQGDHYVRFQFYRNDTMFNDRSDYFITDNAFLRDTISFFELPFDLQPGDEVKVETYSLSEQMFNYYFEFTSILFNDGGIFSPPPVNPRSNIVNLTNPDLRPFGFFQVSSVTSNPFKTPEEIPEQPFMFSID